VASDDRILVDDALGGNRGAFADIVDKYQDRIFNFLYHMTGERETAKDISQDTFCRAYFALNKYNKKYAFTTWLFKIASNLAIDHLRKRRREEVLDPKDTRFAKMSADRAEARSNSPAGILEKKDRDALVSKVLYELPDKYRIVLLLRYFEYMTYREISRTAGIPAGTVMTRLHRARKLMLGKLKNIKEDLR